MSLDIWPEVNGIELMEYGINITHNSRPQLQAAGMDPWKWHGKRVIDTLADVSIAYVNLLAAPKDFTKYDSPNGWGNVKGSTEFTQKLLREASRAVSINREAVWNVSR